MDGFTELLARVLADAGLPDASIHTSGRLDLPGYFRPTKRWDLLVLHEGRFAAATEFKSQAAPSFGNNFNDRTEEAIGNAADLWAAFNAGAFGVDTARPFVGWVMLLEEAGGSTPPTRTSSSHFAVLPEYQSASYAERYEVMLSRLVSEGLYTSAPFLLASEEAGRHGAYNEPAENLSMTSFLSDLIDHVQR